MQNQHILATSPSLFTVVIGIAIFMGALDTTIVNIALPTISDAFGISMGTASWVATIYLLIMAGCILIVGKVADIIGFKNIFLTGISIFTIGSLLCGFLPAFTQSFETLILSRVIQALGGAMMISVAPAMVNVYLPQKIRGKNMGIIMSLAALGTALGPTVGGFLTQYLSWEWIFYINVPIGIIAVLAGKRIIPGVFDKINWDDFSNFDKKGALLIFITLAALLFVIAEGDSFGWTSVTILGSALIGIICLAGFIYTERKSSDPVLDLGLFKSKTFLLLNLIVALVYMVFAGVSYLLPFFLQIIKEFDASTAGLILTALSAGLMICGIIAGLAYNKVGGKRLTLCATILMAIGYSLMSQMNASSSTLYIIACLFLIGAGIGLMTTPLSNMVMSLAPAEKKGMVSSLLSLERFAPMTIGIAFFNLFFVNSVLALAARYGIVAPVNLSDVQDVLTIGFDLSFFVAFIITILVVIITLIADWEIKEEMYDAEHSYIAMH